jgi:hypothetical protein
MIKILSRKSVIVFISAAILSAGIAWACAGDSGEEYGTSNFTPEVFVKNVYSPFFYSDMFYYKIGHDETQNTRFNDDNISDWAAWLNHDISNKELSFLLQNATKDGVDSAYYFMTAKSSVSPGSLHGFAFLNTNNEKTISFLNYLRLAKISEYFAVNEIQSEWDYDSTKKIKVFNARPLNEELKKEFNGTRDIFLKERYWFQLERSYYYNDGFRELVDLFEANEKTMPHNTMYWRTLSYVAGGYYKKKQFSRANYYFSRVYENCDALKMGAHFSFHPQEEKDWEETLSLCRNSSERATLWQMLGVFYSDEKRSISEIYKLDPKNQGLNLLLARAVNKYEQRFNGGSGSEYYVIDTTTRYEDSLKIVISEIALAGNTEKPWIWNMAAGYLNTLDEHYKKADPYFVKASKTIPSEKLAGEQLRLLKLINRIGEVVTIDGKIENEMLPDIQWLSGLHRSETADFRSGDAFNWLRKTFALRYQRQGEVAKSQCFLSNVNFYSDQKNLEMMKSFLSNPAKTPYEKLCTELSDIKLEDIYEFESIRLMYKDSIQQAIEKMSMAGDNGAKMLAANPFNARIQDCHDCDFVAPQKIKYSKLSFLKKVKDIQSKIVNGVDGFSNSLLLANAFYNISQYGNARLFYECKILGESYYDIGEIQSDYRSMLISMDQARKNYELTLSLARTEEQKAKCQYLLAKCQRNQWYNINSRTGTLDEYRMVDLNFLEGFKALKQYPNTQYYKEVIRECGYFRTFIKKNPLPTGMGKELKH